MNLQLICTFGVCCYSHFADLRVGARILSYFELSFVSLICLADVYPRYYQNMTDVQSSPSQFRRVCPNFRWHFPQTDNVPVFKRTAWDNSRSKFSFCAVIFCNSLVTVSMFSSFRANMRSTGLLVEAILLVFSWKLHRFSCVASEAEATNGAVRTTVLKVELLETAAWTGEPKTPARSLTLLNSLSGTTRAHCHYSVNPLRSSKLRLIQLSSSSK